MILPLKDIEHVDKATTFRLGWHGLVIIIRGYAQLFFEFGKARDRDDCAITLLQRLDEVKYLEESGLISPEEEEEADAAKAEHDMLQQARMEGQAVYGFETPGTTRGAGKAIPRFCHLVANDLQSPMQIPSCLMIHERLSLISNPQNHSELLVSRSALVGMFNRTLPCVKAF